MRLFTILRIALMDMYPCVLKYECINNMYVYSIFKIEHPFCHTHTCVLFWELKSPKSWAKCHIQDNWKNSILNLTGKLNHFY